MRTFQTFATFALVTIAAACSRQCGGGQPSVPDACIAPVRFGVYARDAGGAVKGLQVSGGHATCALAEGSTDCVMDLGSAGERITFEAPGFEPHAVPRSELEQWPRAGCHDTRPSPFVVLTPVPPPSSDGGSAP